ncbi:MAG TPA: hypothetical protein VEI97_15510, partial [bacterium]|nr:hypothetical protein [bacterium]
MRFALPALALGVCCLFPGTVDAAPVQSESHGKSPSVKINNYRVTQYQTTRNPHKDLQPLLAGDNAPDLGWLMPDENEVTVLVGLSPRGGLCAEEIRAASVPTVAGTRVRVIGVVLDPPGNRWDADERYWIGDDRM